MTTPRTASIEEAPRTASARPPARWLDSPAALPALALIVAMATLVQAYLLVKLAVLALFLGAAAWASVRGRPLTVHPRLVAYYAAIAVLGVVWTLVGLRYGANHTTGATDAMRLYGLWSVAFLVLFTLLRAERSLEVWHWAIVWAGIAVSLVNLVGLADRFLGWGLMSEAMRTELDQFIEAHDGYVQITSQNIVAMFVVVPYLLAMELRTDAVARHRWLARLSLLLSLTLVALSGRRALWLAVALMPVGILAMGVLTGGLSRFTRIGRRALIAFASALLVGAALVPVAQVLPQRVQESGAIRYLTAAFSAQDERTIQKEFLVEAFAERPLLGAGFGSTARYLRNYERPWTGYELTYHQLLFNLGIVGTALLTALIAAYLLMVLALLRRHPERSAVPFGLLASYCSLLVGAYSNRYFGSFDLLFFAGLLPFLSTFTDGFAASAPTEAA